LELAILELKIANEKSPKTKNLLQEQKLKLLSKNYKMDTELILKEKEYYSNSLLNVAQLKQFLNLILKFYLLINR